jgi:hypothetical protein
VIDEEIISCVDMSVRKRHLVVDKEDNVDEEESVDFNHVQLIIMNRFLIKTKNTQ